MMLHGILPALGAAALIAPALAAQATPPAPVPTRDALEEQRKALHERLRQYQLEERRIALHGSLRRYQASPPEASRGQILLDDSLDREASRRRIVERVDRRIAEAMELLRIEIRAIVEEELARAAPGPVEDVDEARLGAAWRLEPFGSAQPWMGVELAAHEGRESLTVKRVLSGGPAEKAGVREGDRIHSVLDVSVADRSELGAVLGTRLPGDRIEVRVQRGGEEARLSLVLGVRAGGEDGGAVDEDDEEARLAAERAEAGSAREAESAGDAEKIKIGFEDMEVGKAPKGWSFGRTGDGPEGTWTVEKDGENAVLKQSSADPTDFRFPVAVLDGKEFGDFTLTVRYKALSGEVDQVGGAVFRYRDPKTYLICRANALEGNFRLYAVVDGNRKQLKSQNVGVKEKEWHTLRVECRGKEVRCSLDGGEPLVAEIEGFGPGKVGVWTKADAVTLFDDLVVEPIPK